MEILRVIPESATLHVYFAACVDSLSLMTQTCVETLLYELVFMVKRTAIEHVKGFELFVISSVPDFMLKK